jgi:hypothetical protein
MCLRRSGCDRSVGQKLWAENELGSDGFGLTPIQVRQRVPLYWGKSAPPTRVPPDTAVIDIGTKAAHISIDTAGIDLGPKRLTFQSTPPS